MMHGNIVETPSQHPFPDRPAEAFYRHLSQLTATDRDYFRRRAAQEDEAAQASLCSEARIAHEELAAAYRQLCSPGAPDQSHLVTDQTMFRCNPKPTDYAGNTGS